LNVTAGAAGTAGDLTLVARSGTPAPGAGGATFASTFKDPLVNAGGVVSFGASLTGDGVSSSNGAGLWTGPDASHLILVADYQLLEVNYGKQSPDFTPAEFAAAPTFASDLAVPEPSIPSFVLLACAAIASRRRARRHGRLR
jgi:hypothetical protein